MDTVLEAFHEKMVVNTFTDTKGVRVQILLQLGLFIGVCVTKIYFVLVMLGIGAMLAMPLIFVMLVFLEVLVVMLQY